MSDTEDEETKTIKEESRKAKASSKQPSKPTAAITLQEELLEDLTSTLETITSATNLSKVRLQTYQNAVNTDLDNANKYNKNIVGNARISEDVLQAYLESKTYKRIKDLYWTITTEITERLEALDINNPPKSQPTKTFDSELRLPSIDLPNFSGNYDDWLNFINLFNSSVHNRPSLDPVQKLWYLGNSVKGEAHNHIKNLAYTDENYNVAREILYEQYNHIRKIAHTYMKKLFDFKHIGHENSKDIRELISNTKECLVSLKSLGLPTDSWDYILLFHLQPKIPHETSIKWEEHLGSSREIPKFTDFLKFLEDRFRTLEMIEVPAKEMKKAQKALHTKSQPNESSKSSSNPQSKKPSSSKQNTNNNQKPKYPSNNSTNSGRRSYKNAPNATCAICKQSHATSQCNSFRNNPAHIRRQLAKQYKLCFNCLGSSHTIDVCYSTKTCVYCKQQHHSLLHLHELTHPTDGTNSHTTSSHQSQQGQHHLGHSSGLQNIQHSSSFYASSDSQPVRILGTALVRISNSCGYSIIVRALLDSGADDNYIISSTVQNVGLRKYSAVSSITGLNDVTVGSTDYKVNFQIQSLDGTFKYDSSASVVDSITSKMPSQYIDPENFGFLNNLQLADPHFNQPSKVQLLLGVGFMV